MSLYNAIFLDIDGVFNCVDYFVEHDLKQKSGKKDPREWPESTLDPRKIKLFNRVAKLPKTVIVLSSTWRKHNTTIEVEEMLVRNGAEFHLLDKTPVFYDRVPRGDEIKAWLEENAFIDKFVIVDDDSDMGELLPHLVKTDNKDGLLEKHIEEIIKRIS